HKVHENLVNAQPARHVFARFFARYACYRTIACQMPPPACPETIFTPRLARIRAIQKIRRGTRDAAKKWPHFSVPPRRCAA
ncbi:MAG: hypothetical protein RSE46_19130, partial [Janthinobacterium sp.]